MKIQKLQPDVVAKIRSSSALSNVTQCVTELVLNCLDAKSTAIAIRVNLITFRIQVVDNGEGITKENLELVGLRYMTSKCKNLEQLEKHVKFYGFRGESLASMIDISKTVEITSKYGSSSETYTKLFDNRTPKPIKQVKTRPSSGTTVTIGGFLWSLPVRRNRFVPELELEDIKKSIDHLVLIHPKVSFSIRNDVTGSLIMNSKNNTDIISAFNCVHPTFKSEFSSLKVSKNKIAIEALLCKELFESKSLQYIYVNKRPVYCPRIQKFMVHSFYKKQKCKKRKSQNNLLEGNKSKYPAYVVNINCPHSNVDILLNPARTMVEFKNWSVILQCLDKLLSTFLGINKVSSKKKYLTPVKGFKSDCGVSQLCGVQKAFGYKRRKSQMNEVIPEKVQKVSSEKSMNVIEETQFTTKDKKQELVGSNRKEFYFKLDDDLFKFDSKDKFAIDVSTNEKVVSHDSQNVFPDINGKEREIECGDTRKYCKKQVTDSQNIDCYSIISCTQPIIRENRRFKKPLPIKTAQKNKLSLLPNQNLRKLNQYSNIGISPYHNQNQDCMKKNLETNNETSSTSLSGKGKQQSLDDGKSLFSRFTDDENKGKNLIMDMFLKSTQVFNSEEDIHSNPRSEETIFEVESNFLIENNVQTHVNGMSKTMSVSVNVKSTNKIRKPKLVTKRKSSKGIQTSIKGNGTTSRAVQATLNKNYCKSTKKLKQKKIKQVSDDSKLAENYTIVFSDTGAPKFKYIECKNPVSNMRKSDLNFIKECNCNCHLGSGVLFNFDALQDRRDKVDSASSSMENFSPAVSSLKENLLDKTIELFKPQRNLEMNQLSPIEFKVNNWKKGCKYDCRQTLQTKNFKNIVPVRKSVQNSYHNIYLTREKINKNMQYVKTFEYDKSPYFQSKNRHLNKPFEVKPLPPMPVDKYKSYNSFNPKFKSTQFSFCNPFQISTNNHKVDPNFSNNFTLENFNKFQPVYKSTQYDARKNIADFNPFLNSFTNFQNANEIVDSPLNNFTVDLDEQFQPIYKSTQYSKKNISGFNPYFSSVTNAQHINENIDKYNYTEERLKKNYNKLELNDNKNKNLKQSNVENNWHSKSPNIFESDSITNFINVSEDNCDKDDTFLSKRDAVLRNRLCSKPKELFSSSAKAVNPCDESSKLFITLSNQEKQSILKRELVAEKKFNEKKFLNWNSQLGTNSGEILNNREDEWMKKVNNFGSHFYVNKRTGFTTFFTPKPESYNFKLDKRFDFMPKGLSPVMKDIKEVDKSLSQNKKDLLQDYILETHQDDLLIVKWQNCMKNTDPKAFFDEIYKEKAKQFENCLPNIKTMGGKKYPCLNSVISFDKTLFNTIVVIGQLDKKFIVVLEKIKNLIVLFDQHAVHERVRLEKLLKLYENSKVGCEDKFMLFIPRNHLSLLKRNETYLNSLGLTVEFFENGITISEIPSCLYNKFKTNASKLSRVVQMLINEIIEMLKSTRGVSLKNAPQILQNIISLEACRGAIKFGDYLTKSDCIKLLEELSVCKLPFQCAHGRPTLTPLLAVDSIVNTELPLNLKKLLRG